VNRPEGLRSHRLRPLWHPRSKHIPSMPKRVRAQRAPAHSSTAPYPDITGDGIPEALVWLGTGGASTSALTLMRIEDGRPVVALSKSREGKTEPLVLLEGASVMHSDIVDLLPKEQAVFHFSSQYMGDGRLGPCDGAAYRWNSHTKTFDYDSRLSTRLTQDYCRKLPQTNQ
jgi:hypothetical protein